MKVKQLFERFSQPLQTVSICELIDPVLRANCIYSGKVNNIPSDILNMEVYSWSGRTKDYMGMNGYDTDIVVVVDGEDYRESFDRNRSVRRNRRLRHLR